MSDEAEEADPRSSAEWMVWASVIFGPEPFPDGGRRGEASRRVLAVRAAGEAAAALYQRRTMEMDQHDLERYGWDEILEAVQVDEPTPRKLTLPEAAAHAIWAKHYGWAEMGEEWKVPSYNALLARAEALEPHAREALVVVQEEWSGTIDELYEAARIMGESD